MTFDRFLLGSRLPLLILSLLWLSPLSNACAAEIRLRSRAEVRTAIIRLGDIADIVGEPRDVAMLKPIELAVSPTRNGVRDLTLREIRERLILRGVNPIKHRMNGSSVVSVVNTADADYRSRPVQLPETSTPGAVSVQQPAGTGVTTPKPATKANQNPLVAVANRTLRQGDVIGRGDLRLEAARTKSAQFGAVTDPASVLGMEVIRTISSGRPVHDRDLQQPVLVRRNEEAKLLVRVSGVRISTPVKALSNGALDDYVKVEALDSKQQYTARVSGPGQLEILISPQTTQAPLRLNLRERYTHRYQAGGASKSVPVQTVSNPRSER